MLNNILPGLSHIKWAIIPYRSASHVLPINKPPRRANGIPMRFSILFRVCILMATIVNSTIKILYTFFSHSIYYVKLFKWTGVLWKIHCTTSRHDGNIIGGQSSSDRIWSDTIWIFVLFGAAWDLFFLLFFVAFFFRLENGVCFLLLTVDGFDVAFEYWFMTASVIQIYGQICVPFCFIFVFFFR